MYSNSIKELLSILEQQGTSSLEDEYDEADFKLEKGEESPSAIMKKLQKSTRTEEVSQKLEIDAKLNNFSVWIPLDAEDSSS